MEQRVTAVGVLPSALEIVHHESGTLDVEHLHAGEPGVGELVAQIGGAMEVRGGEEPSRVASEHPIGDRRVDRLPHVGLVETIEPNEHVEQGGETGDRGGEQDAARAEHAGGLGQSPEPFPAVREVVERAEEQHDVGAGVVGSEPSGVAFLGGDPRELINETPDLPAALVVGADFGRDLRHEQQSRRPHAAGAADFSRSQSARAPVSADGELHLDDVRHRATTIRTAW